MWYGNAGLSSAASVQLPEFLPLTALYVGRFPSTNHAVAFLWVGGFAPGSQGSPKRLVLAVVQDEAKPQPAQTLQRWAMKGCPFFAPAGGAGAGRPLRGVCTFEILPRDIVGLDYCNPLLMDASRLVIEAKKITRRWFPTLDSCSRHYGWGSAARCQPPEGEVDVARVLTDLYRPCSRDNKGRPELPRVVPHSELRCQPSPHAYWRECPEEKNWERLNRVFLTADRVLRVKREDSVQECSSSDEDHLAACSYVIHHTTVNFRFDDPFVPYVLREVIHDSEHPHLLRLCEAGLPAWAVLLAQYTGLYRRSMRILVSFVLLLLSCVSMLLGFYDLYRRIPAVRALLEEVLGPASGTLQELVVVRLSVLLGWMLPYTAIFRRCWHGSQWLFAIARQIAGGIAWFVGATSSWVWAELGPSVSLLWQPLLAVLSAGRGTLRGLLDSVAWLWSTCWGACWAVTRCIGSFATAGQGSAASQGTSAGLLQAEFKTLQKACMSIYNCVCVLGIRIAKHQASMRLAFARWQLRMRTSLGHFAARRPIFLTCLVACLFSGLASREWVVERLREELPPYLATLSELAPRWPWLPPRSGGAHGPEALEVRLLCELPGQHVCWERGSGGRRCHCPFRALQGINVSLDRPWPAVLEIAPHRHGNGSLTAARASCRASSASARHCLVPAASLERVFHGGVAEVWALGLRRGAEEPRAAAAAFVLQAPRVRAAAPRRVELCAEGMGEPWAALLPACDGRMPGGPTGNASDGQGAAVRARWTNRDLGSCVDPIWQVWLELDRKRAELLCEVGATASRDHRLVLHDSCSGWPRRSALAATEGLRAAVAIRCGDPADAPLAAAKSPRYLPLGRTPLSASPLPRAARPLAATQRAVGVPAWPWTWCGIGAGLMVTKGLVHALLVGGGLLHRLS
mmetsp:Transcript_126527/g.369715  ORF Transcript_126527/g.369715 Transcript_126527/m.369715 type:complete len:912 (-) Transcript_126527:142-2877(-)